MSKGGRGNRQGGQERQEPTPPATAEPETTQSAELVADVAPAPITVPDSPAPVLEQAPPPAAEPPPAPPTTEPELTPPLPNGWVRCRALKACLVRGVAEEPGKEFWLELEQAERLASKGALERI